MNGMRICEILWTAFLALWIVWASRAKSTQAREGIGSRLSYTIFAVAAFYFLFARSAAAGWLATRLVPDTPLVEGLGVAVTVAGLAFAIWARSRLAGNWSGFVTVKVGHELVRTGPYRWVRHPIYTGMTAASAGTALALGQARGALAAVLLYVGFKIKSRIEERTMAGVFGADYAEYRQHTGALFPRLRR